MDTQAYNNCVREWSDPLYRFACRCIGDREDARDAVQTAFAALWEARAQVVPEKAKAWLFQVTYRKSVDSFRHQSRMRNDEFLEERPAAESVSDLRRTLDGALDRLEEQSRALVLLKDWEGYSYEEIGRITGLSESQVKVYLHRARRQLKNYLVSIENVLS